MIRNAGAGCDVSRERFAHQYGPAIAAYFAARWRGQSGVQDLDDAVQEVFVECFKNGGALQQVDQRPAGFRPYLYGVLRNVARRLEATRGQQGRQRQVGSTEMNLLQPDEAKLSQVFDRSWARQIMREAGQRLAAAAGESGSDAARRVELLRLRFEEDLPIRAIAQRWGVDAAGVHRDYARARNEFRQALLDVLAGYCADDPAAARRECAHLLALLA